MTKELIRIRKLGTVIVMVTMTDVAKKGGVSQTLVSLVLNGRDKEIGISQKTRDKILKVAKEIGYCRNEMAVSIVKRKSKVLALVSADMGGVEYAGRVLNGVFAEANARDYAVNVYHLGKNRDRIAQKIIGWMTSGVIFHVKEIKQVADLCAILGKNNIPYGFANLSNPDGIGVTTDDYQGTKTAIKYLADHGAKKILFLTHQYRGTEYLQKRESGYLDAMREFLPDVKAESVCLGNSLDAGIVEKIRSVLEKKKPDALFCAGDDIAMRAESAILNLKLRIPEDIQVIGYGNLQMGQFAPVLLSTVDQDYERMGRLVVQCILSKENTKRSQYLPVKLIIRESTKKENES